MNKPTSIPRNQNLTEKVKITLEEIFKFRANQNQLKELARLAFEILQRDKLSFEELIQSLSQALPSEKYCGPMVFAALKSALLKRRFPLTAEQQVIEPKSVFLDKLSAPLRDNYPVTKEFKPLKIFVEKSVRNSYLLKNFQKKYPTVKIEEVNYYSDYLKKNKFTISELKKPYVFIVKEKWDFLKPCPCTSQHLGCGYWILNLGFGCPYDCSYCFLQHYTNFPGIILPANLDNFFERFNQFSKTLKQPIRIGTGEFCDSLALDEVTEYSQKLVPYFEKKPVFFELKTKSAAIDNLLKLPASPNIIISWSLNPPGLIESEEIAVANLTERLAAARKIKEAGYSIGFHFDPIIHYPDWQKDYQRLVDTLYRYVKPAFAWISLGTLRFHRSLKTIAGQRFPQSKIFYGELFTAEDKKQRYPKFLRSQIYQNMRNRIRKYDPKTPVYLCMESKDMWDTLGMKLKSTSEIERYILRLDK